MPKKKNKVKFDTNKKIDFFFIIIFPIIAILFSLVLHANFLTSIILFYAPLGLWLSIRTPKKVVKTLVFALIFSIPLSIFVDYIGTIDGAWFVPVSVFPFRVFNVIPIEDFIFGFLLIYDIVIFYEHFLDKGDKKIVEPRMKYLIWILITLVLVVVVALAIQPKILAIKYAYFWMGTIMLLIPTLTLISAFPKLLAKYVKAGSYFFVLSLLFELVGLHLKQWSFPGNNFIGWVELFGYRFPFEEFFFWFVMIAVGVLSFYEYFDDDCK